MSLLRTVLSVGGLWLVLGVPPTFGDSLPRQKTALDDYMAKPDPAYGWKLVKTIPGEGHTTYIVDLNSQSWRSQPEVDRPVWQHFLTIVKPDPVKFDTA